MAIITIVWVLMLLAGVADAASPQPCPGLHPPGNVDLGYAKHVPSFTNKTSSGQSVSVYKNIRFANPPVGSLRFRRPDTNLKRVSGIQDGDVPWGSRNCISSAPSSMPFPDINGTTWGQEDCLFLDVYVPEGVKPGDRVPVLHYIHGGAYAFGSKEFFFNPLGLFDHMFTQNLGKFIVVANNYRLGVSGWAYSEDEQMDSNVGLFDCLAAIEWTSKYIERFGGDGESITASGQSAGAGTLYYMLTLLGGKGKQLPFKQVFISSPAVPPRRNVKEREIELFKIVQEAANCSSLRCLRSIPEEKLLAANDVVINQMTSTGGGGVLGPVLGFGPAPDGKYIPDIPAALFRDGRWHHEVERVVVGTMANEGMGTSHDTGMPEYFPMMVRQIMPKAKDGVISEIQSGYSWRDPAELAWDWTTDVIWACNAYNLAMAIPGKTRRYIMSTPPAVHGQDLYSYFYVDQDSTPVEDPGLSRTFQTQILDFIHGRELEWPTYGSEQRLYNITDEFEVAELPKELERRCQTINRFVLDPVNGA